MLEAAALDYQRSQQQQLVTDYDAGNGQATHGEFILRAKRKSSKLQNSDSISNRKRNASCSVETQNLESSRTSYKMSKKPTYLHVASNRSGTMVLGSSHQLSAQWKQQHAGESKKDRSCGTQASARKGRNVKRAEAARDYEFGTAHRKQDLVHMPQMEITILQAPLARHSDLSTRSKAR